MAEYTQFYKACSAEERVQMLTDVTRWDGKSMYLPLEVQPAAEAVAVQVVAA